MDKLTPKIVLRHYEYSSLCTKMGREEYLARIRIEMEHSELDGVEVVPASLMRSEAELARVALEVGNRARVRVSSQVRGNHARRGAKTTG